MKKQNFSCSALIVAPTRKSIDLLSNMLCGSFSKPFSYAESGAEARQKLIEHSFDAVIINSPLPDETGVDLAMDLSQRDCGTLLLVKGEIFDEVSHKVENTGVMVMSKPFPAQFFLQAQQLLLATCRKIRIMKDECSRLQTKLEETRIVSYAKCLMIEFMGLTEQEAHRQIEKQAMDGRVSRRKIAEQIIKKYEC